MKLDLKSVLAAGTILCAGTLSAAGTPVASATYAGIELNLRFETSGGRTTVDGRGSNGRIAWNNTGDWADGGSDEAAAVSVTAQDERLVWNGGLVREPVGDPVVLVDAQKGEGIAQLPDRTTPCRKLVRTVGGEVADTVYIENTDGGLRGSVTIEGVTRPQSGRPLTVVVEPFDGASVDEATLTATWYRAAYDQVPEAGEAFATGLEYVPTPEDYEHWFMVVVSDAAGVVAVGRPFWFSKLPVVYLTTEGAREPTAAKEDHAGTVYIQGNAEYAAQCGKPDDYAAVDNLHVRGNTTAQQPKKPYKVKLGKKTDLFGMGKNKHWVLLANYLDPGLMRNKVLYDAANRLGCLGMKSVWVEVVLNGQFRGNYQLCEQLRISSGRVDIANWEDIGEAVADAIAEAEGLSDDDTAALETQMAENLAWVTSRQVTFKEQTYDVDGYDDPAVAQSKDITSGYLFEFDKYDDEASKFQLRSGALDMLTKLNMPEFLCTNTEMMDYCKGYLEDFFDAVQAADGCDANGRHYTALADIDAMAGYWLTQVLAANSDSQGYSRFAYKGQSGKLVWGPIWDLDHSVGYRASDWTVNADANGAIISCVPADDCSSGWHNGNHFASGPSVGDAERAKCNFYPLWCDDPYFCLKLREHWLAARDYLMELVADGGTIDKHYDYLLESGNVNYRMWPVQTQGNATFPFEGNLGNARQFKRLLKARINWIDTQMATLEGLVNSLNKPSECKADHPYVDSASKFDFDIKGSFRKRVDSAETRIPDVSVVGDGGFTATVTVDDDAVTAVDVSVNGIFHQTCPVVDKAFDVTVGTAALTVSDGRRNLVAFSARRGEAVPLTTYALVTKSALFPTPFDETNVVCTPEVDWEGGFDFTGEGVCPRMTVKDGAGNDLVEGRDYVVTYVNNVYPGTGRMILAGTGNPAGTGDFEGRLNWVGSIERTFVIKRTEVQTVAAQVALDTRDDSPRAPETFSQILRFAYTSKADWSLGGVTPRASIVVTDTVNGGSPEVLTCKQAEGSVRWSPKRASTYRIALLIDGVEVESCLMEISERVMRSKQGLIFFITRNGGGTTYGAG